MKSRRSILLYTLLILTAIIPACYDSTSEPETELDISYQSVSPPSSSTAPMKGIKLPAPNLKGDVSLEETLFSRRSIRDYSDSPLLLSQVSQLLWAAQGITDADGGRTAPSAGALYPLEIYLTVGNVDDLTAGVYKYIPQYHELVKLTEEDVSEELARAALDQTFIQEAAINIIIGAVYKRTTIKYGDRGIRYVHMEAGHAAQNICLQATALNLGAVTVGAFYDDIVSEILNMPEDETPLYIIPVGNY